MVRFWEGLADVSLAVSMGIGFALFLVEALS